MSARDRSGKSTEAPLGIRGRVNFEYLLQEQIAAYQFVLKSEEFKEAQVKEVIKGFVDIIPSDWTDKQFRKELKKAIKIKLVDIRPLVAGNTRMSEKVCAKLGIPSNKKETTFDYRAIMQACINLLNRRKLLAKVNPVEEISMIELEKIGETEAAKTRKDNIQHK